MMMLSSKKLNLGKSGLFKGSALPYITNTVAQELRKKFGRDALLKGGMRVQTTVDAKFQAMAEETIKDWHGKLQSEGLSKNQMGLGVHLFPDSFCQGSSRWCRF